MSRARDVKILVARNRYLLSSKYLYANASAQSPAYLIPVDPRSGPYTPLYVAGIDIDECFCRFAQIVLAHPFEARHGRLVDVIESTGVKIDTACNRTLPSVSNS